ncbi:MAG TPA: hypothetical protein VF126_15895 [Acidobacteriaceae bacterium]
MSSIEERTAPAVRSSLVRSIFSFPAMLVALLMVLAVLTLRDRFSDPDMWWHLRTGQVIWTTHTIPQTDLFSWTTNHHAWVPHEWLSQVIIYGAYRFGGYSGLMLFLCVATGALLIGGYLLCTLYSSNAKVALVGALVIWFFATSGLAIRPQMIGYLLLIAELIIFHLATKQNPRWFLCLPLLFALWVNCHGSFFLGIVVGWLLYACSFFRFQMVGFRAAGWSARARHTCAIALILSVIALFLNPVGYRQVLYPLQTMLAPNLGVIQEFAPLALTSPRGVGFLAVLVAIALLMIYGAELYWHEVALIVAGTWLAISHTRMVFVFGILAAPILCRLLSPKWDRYELERDLPVANGLIMVAGLAIAVAGFPSRSSLYAQVRKRNPEGAVDYIKTHAFSGHMLNEWTQGGYLVWALPEHPDFVDGRGDVFAESGVLADYASWAELNADPRSLLDKYHIDFCLLSRNSPMSHVMPLLPAWRMAYADDIAIVFVHDRAH